MNNVVFRNILKRSMQHHFAQSMNFFLIKLYSLYFVTLLNAESAGFVHKDGGDRLRTGHQGAALTDRVKRDERFWMDATDRQTRPVANQQLRKETQEDRANLLVLPEIQM